MEHFFTEQLDFDSADRRNRNGSVNISAPANTSAPRTGVVNAAGKFLTIYQPGPTCTPSVAPSQPVGPAGGAYTLNVQYSNGGSGCAWNAVSQSSAAPSHRSGNGGGERRSEYRCRSEQHCLAAAAHADCRWAVGSTDSGRATVFSL